MLLLQIINFVRRERSIQHNCRKMLARNHSGLYTNMQMRIPNGNIPECSPVLMKRSLASEAKSVTSYYPNNSVSPINRPREKVPLVVILPWLYARPKHVSKYIDLYHKRGYDVITCSISLPHCLWPPLTYPITEALCQKLSSTEFSERPLIFHSFSVGAYMLSVLFSQITSDPESYQEMTDRIKGFVNDSVTIGGTSRISVGIARSVTQSTVAQACITNSLMTYFSLTHRWTVRLYDIFEDSFYNYPVPEAPSLYFYSHDDPMSDPSSVADVIKHQKLKSYDIHAVDWKSSAHTQHYIYHPQEYTSALDEFLMKIDPNNSQILCSKL